MKIAVIGCGSSAVFFLDKLAKGLEETPELRTKLSSLVVFRGADEIGDPNSFGRLPDYFLLNTPNFTLDPIIPGWREFRSIASNSGSISAHSNKYSSRRLLGAFLKENFSKSLARISRWIQVEVVGGQVHSIAKERGKYLLVGSDRAWLTERVILCLGRSHGPRLNSSVGNKSILTPYSSTLSKLPKTVRVGVIGTGLRAVDALRALFESGHQGPIHSVSRRGRLPRVQPAAFELGRQEWGVSAPLLRLLDAAPGSLDLVDLWRALKSDYRALGIPLRSVKMLLERQATDSLTWSREVNDAAFGDRRWWLRAFELTSWMEELWLRLSVQSQINFQKHLRSTWISNLVAIPSENGEVICSLFRNDQLTVHSGYRDVALDRDSGAWKINFHDRTIGALTVDYLVDATPNGFQGDEIHPLLAGLWRQGLAMLRSNESLVTDWDSGTIQPVEDQNETGLFYVVEAAIGPNLVSNSIELNLKMAEKTLLGLKQGLGLRADPFPGLNVSGNYAAETA